MSVELNESELRAHLIRIASAAEGDERHSVADELLVYLHSIEALELWGRNLARHFGRPAEHEEVTSVITEALMKELRAIDADRLEKVGQVRSYLYYRAKASVQAWLDSPAVTLASEMSGITRRHRTARVGVRELRANLNREPEPEEVVSFVNNRLVAARGRDAAVKSGALITVEDVEGTALRTYSMDYSEDSELNDSFGAPDDGQVTLRAEVGLTVTQLQQRAVRMFGPDEGDEVREVLALWVRMIIAGEQPTVVAVSRQFGLSRRAASTRLRQVNAVLTAFRADDDAARAAYTERDRGQSGQTWWSLAK